MLSVDCTKIEDLRKADPDFNAFFLEVTSKIEALISKRNAQKSYHFKDSVDYEINIRVKAIPLTKEQAVELVRYLNQAYISKVSGDRFEIRKIPFKNYYRIKSGLNYSDIICCDDYRC